MQGLDQIAKLIQRSERVPTRAVGLVWREEGHVHFVDDGPRGRMVPGCIALPIVGGWIGHNASHGSAGRSKKISSTREAERENKLKFVPSALMVAPSG